MSFPIAIVNGVTALATFAKKSVDTACQYAMATDVIFAQNYRTRRLSCEISKLYTTNTKDVTGSIIPDIMNKDKNLQSQTLDELIHALYNQTKGINIK